MHFRFAEVACHGIGGGPVLVPSYMKKPLFFSFFFCHLVESYFLTALFFFLPFLGFVDETDTVQVWWSAYKWNGHPCTGMIKRSYYYATLNILLYKANLYLCLPAARDGGWRYYWCISTTDRWCVLSSFTRMDEAPWAFVHHTSHFFPSKQWTCWSHNISENVSGLSRKCFHLSVFFFFALLASVGSFVVKRANIKNHYFLHIKWSCFSCILLCFVWHCSFLQQFFFSSICKYFGLFPIYSKIDLFYARAL